MKINYRLLPVKAHFFLVFAGLAPILPFIPVFAKQLGIDAIGSSVLFAVLPFVGMLAKPVAGWIADRLQLEKTVFILSIILSGLFYLSLKIVPDLVQDNSATFQCSEPESVLRVCNDDQSKQNLISSLSQSSCPIKCELSCTLDDETVMRSLCSAFENSFAGCFNDSTPLDLLEAKFTIISNLSLHDTQPNPGCLLLPVDSGRLNNLTFTRPFCSTKTDIDCQVYCEDEEVRKFVRKDSVFSSGPFWLFFILNIVAYSAFSVCTSMGDAICFHLMDNEPGQHYGAQRVWGSIGWGTFTVMAGYLVDTYSQDGVHGHKDYTPALLLMVGLLLLDLVCVWRMKISSRGAPPQGSPSKDICGLLVTPRITVFVGWCTTVGILTSVIWQWLPWFLSDLANHQALEQNCDSEDNGAEWLTLLLGLNMGIQCFVGEVPMFFISGWIISKLGHTHTMTLVLAAFGLRFLAYSFLTNPWYSLPIEVLNGITFGVFYSTMASYTNLISPPGLSSTMQGLMGGAFEGGGVAIGSLLGGSLYKFFGGAMMFRVFGLFSLALAPLHALLHFLLDRFLGATQDSANRFDQKEFSVVASFDKDSSGPIVKSTEHIAFIDATEELPIINNDLATKA